MSKPVRKRRSPQEARLEILEVAQARLREHGVAGLNVADVARGCGMSHATVIHHFGSTAGMRRALVEHMTDALLRDVIETLSSSRELDAAALVSGLFQTLSEDGHANLVAWLAVSGDEFGQEMGPSEPVKALFAQLNPIVAAHLDGAPDPAAAARHVVFLAATSALGYGIGGDRWAEAMGLSVDEVRSFPAWLGGQIDRLGGEP